MASGHFLVRPVPPFRLDFTVWALRRRGHNVTDRWDGTRYRRAIALDERRFVVLQAEQIAPPERARLKVEVTGVALDAATRRLVRRELDRLLGLSIELQPFYALAANDRRLAPLAARFRGLKPPRFATLFEGLVNGIACQQISLNVGITLLNRLVEAFGPVTRDMRSFPAPQDLAGQNPARLRSLGFSANKVHALLDLATAVCEGRVDLEMIRGLDNTAATAWLRQLRGVGRWTAEYLLLRGLGRLAIFPGDDAGARQRLAHWLELPSPLDYARVGKAVAPWQPYAGVVYFHLLLYGLAEAGVLAPASSGRTDGAG